MLCTKLRNICYISVSNCLGVYGLSSPQHKCSAVPHHTYAEKQHQARLHLYHDNEQIYSGGNNWYTKCFDLGRDVLVQHLVGHDRIHWPFNVAKSSCTLSRKTPVRIVFFLSYLEFLFFQTWQVELMPESSILLSSDHNTFSCTFSESFRFSVANLGRHVHYQCC